MVLAAGTKLGPYQIIAPIGAGGMGEVYKASDLRLNRLVAIEVAHARFSERFEREARAIAALNHQHLHTLRCRPELPGAGVHRGAALEAARACRSRDTTCDPSSRRTYGPPRKLFIRAKPGLAVSNSNLAVDYDLTKDGRQFLMTTVSGESDSAPITVMLNWTTGLKR
jgi:serine/threonine protein kinase